MANIATTDELPLNGIAPVNICVDVKRRWAEVLTCSQSYISYLDHDHSERENVRFLAMWPFVQHLWRGPSWSETTLTLGTLRGIQILSDSGEPKIRDTRITGVVHEDVLLETCQYGGEAGPERPHTPLRSP